MSFRVSRGFGKQGIRNFHRCLHAPTIVKGSEKPGPKGRTIPHPLPPFSSHLIPPRTWLVASSTWFRDSEGFPQYRPGECRNLERSGFHPPSSRAPGARVDQWLRKCCAPPCLNFSLKTDLVRCSKGQGPTSSAVDPRQCLAGAHRAALPAGRRLPWPASRSHLAGCGHLLCVTAGQHASHFCYSSLRWRTRSSTTAIRPFSLSSISAITMSCLASHSSCLAIARSCCSSHSPWPCNTSA